MLILVGSFFAVCVYKVIHTPVVVMSIITGKPIAIINSDGTEIRITKLTVLPKRYTIVWEDPSKGRDPK